MFWNKLPYWLRGGIVILVIPLVALLGLSKCVDLGLDFGCLVLLPFVFPTQFLQDNLHIISIESNSVFNIFNFIIFFVLGSLLGMVYGKLSVRNNLVIFNFYRIILSIIFLILVLIGAVLLIQLYF